MRYAIFDPTGNVTALVEDPVDEDLQPEVARRIMEAHPEVEQVGFVDLTPHGEALDGEAIGALRMAGGEFCGNATMSAAALFAERGLVDIAAEGQDGVTVAEGSGTRSVLMRVSGAGDLVEVGLRLVAGATYEGAVRMPPAHAIDCVTLAWEGVRDAVPVVFMEGISHAIVREDAPFAPLADDPASAEAAVRAWCSALGVDGLGLMFLRHEGSERALRPLVFVPGADTCFWERSCASGTSACGMYEARRAGTAVDVSFREPGGVLRVTSAPDGRTWLHGHVREVARLALA